MAGKEHQGLQVALILFVLVTVVLAVTTFIFYKQSEEQLAKANGLKKDKAIAEDGLRAVEEDLAALKTALKKPVDMTVADIAAEIKDLETKYSATYNEPATGIMTALANQREVFLQLQASQLAHQAQIDQLQGDKVALNGQIAILREGYGQDKNVQIAQLLEARKLFEDDRKKFVASMNARESALTSAQRKITEVEVAKDAELRRLADLYRKEQKEKQNALAELEGTRATDTTSPDGKITGTSERSRLVWIDVGSADGLRRQTTFSVYDRDISQITEETPVKAKIEVVKTLGAHRAEARIISDNIKNPILTEDKIYSSAFTPGQQEHFAIAGIINIDGDGRDDLQQLRSIISINGGIVDASVDSQGNRSGKPTYKTRFLIMGDPPTDSDEAIRAYSKLQDDAANAGVKKISLSKFLDYIGYVGREHSVGLGDRAKASNFAPGAGRPNSAFRPRQPK